MTPREYKAAGHCRAFGYSRYIPGLPEWRSVGRGLIAVDDGQGMVYPGLIFAYELSPTGEPELWNYGVTRPDGTWPRKWKPLRVSYVRHLAALERIRQRQMVSYEEMCEMVHANIPHAWIPDQILLAHEYGIRFRDDGHMVFELL